MFFQISITFFCTLLHNFYMFAVNYEFSILDNNLFKLYILKYISCTYLNEKNETKDYEESLNLKVSMVLLLLISYTILVSSN